MLEIRQATEADVATIINVQNRAFLEDYQKYGYCPGYGRDRDSMLASLKQAQAYLLLWDNEAVGTMAVLPEGDRDYCLGCLCVVPEYQNKGIGSQALAFLDQAFADALQWRLVTPADKEGNLHFYRKHGYRVRSNDKDNGVEVVLLERLVFPMMKHKEMAL